MITAYDIHPTLTAYEAAPPLSLWLAASQPKDEMLWKGGFQAQAEWMPRLAAYGAHSEPRVIATHRSKSIDLPVPAILVGNPSSEWAVLMLRDNFYDVNLGVVSSVPLTIPLDLVFSEMSREHYQTQKKRAQDSKMMGDITDAQWEDGSWYSQWSSGELVIDSGKLWLAPRAFSEGISRVPGIEDDRYKQGCTSFVTVLYGSDTDEVIKNFAKIVLAVRDNLNP